VSSLFPEYEELRREPWWGTMSELAQASPEPADPGQTMDLCVTLAIMRARAQGRDVVPLDAVLAESLLCWNPFKPSPEGIFRDAADGARATLTRRLRERVAPVSPDSRWIRAGTDRILRGMAQRDANLPTWLFLG
jgi:hypothetical protein